MQPNLSSFSTVLMSVDRWPLAFGAPNRQVASFEFLHGVGNESHPSIMSWPAIVEDGVKDGLKMG